MFNEQLARNALKAIEANPQEWDQEVWRCETGMCFAGFVAMEAGAHWAHPADSLDADVVITPYGTESDAVDFAAQELGFRSFMDCWSLFRSENTLDDLKREIDKYSSK